jgi:hypothetical protein
MFFNYVVFRFNSQFLFDNSLILGGEQGVFFGINTYLA